MNATGRGSEPVSLQCRCGRRLKAAGAHPGRLGRCPSCGATFRVPESPEPAPAPRPAARPKEGRGGYALAAEEPASSTVAPPPPTPSIPERRPSSGPVGREGLVRAPTAPEGTLAESLKYPVWDSHGLALLLFLPPTLWLTSLFSIGLIPSYVMGDDEVQKLGAMTMVLPMSGLLALALGYVLTFIGEALVLSARGEVHHPRMPGFHPGSALRALGLWLGAGASGAIVGGLPALAYAIGHGVAGWADGIVLAGLALPGLAYATVALIAVLMHESLAAAGPGTVLPALLRVGPRSVPVVLLVAATAAVDGAAVAALLRYPNEWTGTVGLWAFWVAFLYQALVLARVLGLFYARHAKALKWFPDRPRWGVG